MLSRAGQLTRLNSFIVRQFTTATSLSTKPTQLKEAAESESASNLDHSNSSDKTKKNFQNRPKTSKNFTNVKNYNNTNIKNYNNRNNNQQNKYANNNESVAKNQSSNKYKPISNDTKKQFNLNAVSKELEYNPKHQETYKEALYAIQTSSSNQNLIESCQKLNHLYDSDLKVAEQFNTDPIKPKVVKNILSNLDKMNTDEFITSANFISRFEPNKFDRLQRHITENLAKYNVGHLIKIVSMMRSLAYHKPEAMDMLRELTEKLRGRIDELDSVADAKRALKLFSHESSLVQRIDMRLSQLADKLTLDEWIELLNTKSILRQRNMSILEICAYNIVKLAQGESTSKKVNLSLEQIQKCMLSCGILNYNEMSFYKFLLSQLNDTLSSAAQSTTKPTSSWLSENEQHLLAIITSLGMLQLRDENTLDTVCSLLKANRDRSKLIVSFVQTCGALNYTPKSSSDFAQIIASVTESAFNLGDDRDRANFLNYVWSLCALNKADQYLIASVLEKKFFDSILNDKKAKDFKSNLLKILNINMHSMFRMDNYEGPNLPEDFNLAQYSELLAAKKNSHANETLISTLAGFRSINKYVKVNLLTSFGILIDAFMIVDKNGNPQPLDKYLSKDSPSEMTEDEMRVAFKLIGFKDQTLINKNINGIIMFQLSLLKEVGYHPVIVYQDELQSASLTNRVELIQKKLKELTKNKK